MDSLLQWDNLQKSQFYKGLPESLAKLPQRVRLHRVFPCLVRDLTQPAMVPFVLPNILDIAQHCSQKEFVKYILPFLKPVMKLTDPVQILLIFLQRMELMLKLTPAEDVQQHVLPMLYRGLDADTPQIHELCLSILPTFAGLIDHANVKNHLLPRIKKLCLSTANLSVRVNCLLCIGRLLEHLDKWLVLDEVLPFLTQIPSREPAVLMGILGIYKLALNHKKLGISKEVMATRVLPFLMPLCIENGLNLSQFNALVALVKQMFSLVETEHRTKLEQLNSVQQERKTLEATMPEVASPTSTNGVQLHSAFNGLGLDNFMSSSTTSPSLSLQDKQKLSQQQETMKVLQNQSPLDPAPVSNVSRVVQPKDLTQELPKNIIPQISSPPQSKTPLNSMNSLNSLSSLSMIGNDLISKPAIPTSMTFPTAMNMQSPQSLKMQPVMGINSMQNTNGSNWNKAPSPMWQSPAQNMSNSQSMQWASPTPMNGQSKNWSALDNLLPNSVNAPAMGGRTPMNQMMSNQPLIQSPPNNTNKSNALSKDDIMDLLS